MIFIFSIIVVLNIKTKKKRFLILSFILSSALDVKYENKNNLMINQLDLYI